ncbi:MAG: hypothetical protein LBQ16_02550 [Gracilibacteraceae bacterium]|nr:hypothetical protein [Gracilibacteraceae bacterium]
MRKRLLLVLGLFVSAQLVFMVDGFAYIDPSAATYVIQAVAGVVIAGGAAITIYWRKIKRFFKERKHG